MANCKRTILLAFALFMSLVTIAQDNTGTEEKTELMRSEGKIYVVVAIVITILAGLLLYVVRLDRKISNLERGSHS